jgi:hypothetical protein
MLIILPTKTLDLKTRFLVRVPDAVAFRALFFGTWY